VSLDVQSPDLLSPIEAAKLVPGRRGKSLHPRSINRWAVHGVNGILLESVRIGGKVMTTAESLRDFFRRLTARRRPRRATSKVR
jgi:hypothetical protein